MSARKKPKGRNTSNQGNRGAVHGPPVRGGRVSGADAPSGPAVGSSGPRAADPVLVEMCYVDVAAVRIQQWINRTPRIRYRRGASNLLQEITSKERVLAGPLPVDVSWNDDAGEVSGVVTVRFEPDPGAEVRAQALKVAASVAQGMRAEARALEISSRYGLGTTYDRARLDMTRRFEGEGPLLDLPPQLCEVPAAKVCDECRISPAMKASVTVAGDSRSLCADCLARARAAGGLGADTDERLPKSQARLIRTVRALLPGQPADISHPVDLTALAGMAKHHRVGDTPSQLATIVADGNRVGDFMASLGVGGDGRDALARNSVVAAIDAATAGAVARAAAVLVTAEAAWSGPAGVSLPVLAHFIGGDDIAVSVPAVSAWPFLRNLVDEFDAVIRSQLRSAAPAPRATGLKWPTLSAGLVFHHRAAPIPDVLAKAHDQMDTAKRHNAGAQPAVSFLDMTADGAAAPQARSVELSWLTAHAGLLDDAARVPRAQRSQLVALLRECAAATSYPALGEDAVQALNRRLKTMDIPAMTQAAGPDLGVTPESRQSLRAVLDLARWWAPSRQEEDR